MTSSILLATGMRFSSTVMAQHGMPDQRDSPHIMLGYAEDDDAPCNGQVLIILEAA